MLVLKGLPAVQHLVMFLCSHQTPVIRLLMRPADLHPRHCSPVTAEKTLPREAAVAVKRTLGHLIITVWFCHRRSPAGPLSPAQVPILLSMCAQVLAGEYSNRLFSSLESIAQSPMMLCCNQS